MRAYRTKLHGLKFRQRILLLPSLAAAALALILLLVIAVGRLNDRRLAAIRDGYYPSLELSRTLQQTLAAIRFGLEDAVAARDSERLARVDSLRDAFVAA